MKKLHIVLALAIAFTMTAFAQNAPKGKNLPFAKMSRTKMVSPIKADLVTPPATAVIETDWVLEGNYINNSTAYANTNTIEVAFDGNDVYIKGMVFLCPDAWIKGTIDGATATFANGQYAGTYGSDPIYACGSDGELLEDIVFDYDAAKKSFELTNYYIENTETDSFSFYLFSYDIVLYKDIAQPAPTNVTVTPAFTTADVAWVENGGATTWNLRYRYMPEILNQLWDFESTDQLEDWMVVDNDGDDFYWEWANARFSTHSGNGVVVSASYDADNKEALYPDNWLISPVIPMGGTVSFWYCGQDEDYCEEVFGVYLFVGNEWTSLDDFVKIGEDVTAGAEFQKYVLDLSGYEGIGCVAIRHYNVSDMFYLNIDDFCVEQPGGAYPGEWVEINGVTNNPYTIEGLTPETNYQVEVQAVGEGTSDWSPAVDFTTPAIPDVYMLGGSGQPWNPTSGIKFDYTAEDNIYTNTITFPDENNYFGFTTELAENNDDGGWAYIEPFRFGAVAEGENFIYNDSYNGQPLSLTWDEYKSFCIPAGEYNLTVDLTSMKLIIKKVVPAHDYDKGDVNHDHNVNIADVTALIDYLLGTGTACEICADVNGDSVINIADVTALIDLLLGN